VTAQQTSPDEAISAPNSRRILTIPNVMSVIRLGCIPLFLYLLIGRDNRAAAAWLLGGLGATDWVDGYVARRFDQVSEIGKVLDPTADRLMFIVSIIGIVSDGAGPTWFYVLVFAREALFGGAVFVATLAGMKRFDVTWLGKLDTFVLMFAVPGFLLGSAFDFPGHRIFYVFSYIIGIPALVLSYYVAIAYIPTLRANLRDGRSDRAAKARTATGASS
jgi:cardiolipin synthase